MKKSFEYKQLISKSEYEMIEISTSTFDSLDPRHIIKVTRPQVDEASIRKNVQRNYAEQLTSGMFPDEIKKEMDNEIELAINNEKERIEKLPAPIIFVGNIIQVKNGSSVLLRISIPLDVALYFIYNKRKIDQMYIELDRMPFFEDIELRSKHFEKLIDDFKKENNIVHYTADIWKDYIKNPKQEI